MATILKYPDLEEWRKKCKRPAASSASMHVVSHIFEKIKRKGDDALVDFTRKYDKVELSSLKVSGKEIHDACLLVEHDLKKAMHHAFRNILRFHKKTSPKKFFEIKDKHIHAWKKHIPLDVAGLYVPGGNAPLFSSVLMLGIPAMIAGCREVVLCTPPGPEGKIHPAILYAAHLCNIRKIFKCGGAQAIAAMALGTKTIPKADKIFGPGNVWVTAAKQYALGTGLSAIDMPAGPSELLIIADSSANPSWVAADLLSQCEHGPDSQTVLLTTSGNLLYTVQKEVQRQLLNLPSASLAYQSWNHSLLVVLKNLKKCVEYSNLYAPEHLMIHSGFPEKLTNYIRHAGSVFLGSLSTEPMGDYISGPNHTLPTAGFARAWSGLTVESFMKTITFQKISPAGLRKLGSHAIRMAMAEKLPAHAKAVQIRLTKKLKRHDS